MKTIVYLDYVENGLKKRNGGFLKLEYRPERVVFTLQVNSGFATDTLNCPVRDAAGNRKGELRLERGKGRLDCDLSPEDTPEWVYDGFVEIRISGGRAVTGRWTAEKKPEVFPGKVLALQAAELDREMQAAETNRESKGLERRAGMKETESMPEADAEEAGKGIRSGKVPETDTEGAGKEVRSEKVPETDTRAGKEIWPGKVPETDTEGKGKEIWSEIMPETKAEAQPEEQREKRPEAQHEKRLETGAEAKPEKRTEAQAEALTFRRGARAPAPESGEVSALDAAGAKTVQGAGSRETAQYYDDKWEQLCHVFSKIHPFGDEREYLSITPGDFIIFRQQYQKLVHNSFLLHGFYNYQHLILGKFYQNRRVLYYLGTPGVYHEKEKMAAEMFGFEAFEYAGDRIEEGTFGYYMRRVEI